MPPVSMILGLLAYAPQAITQINDLYQAIRHTFSPSDQAEIDQALAASQSADATSTAAAVAALDASSKR